jgi:hypothetical protein
MDRIRPVVVVLVLALSLASSSFSAFAGPQWCEEDPEFVVNGAIVDVTTLFDASYAPSMKGSVNFVLQVPSNVVAAVVAVPGGVPVTASISPTLSPYIGIGQIPVVLSVSMKTSASFDTYTQITGLSGYVLTSVSGTSTKPTHASFAMYGL